MLHTVFSTLMSIITIFALLFSSKLVKEGYKDILNTNIKPSTTISWIILNLAINILNLIFTITLLSLHYSLLKLDLTAYEYILFQKDKKLRLEWLKDGAITQEEFDEENKRAMDDIRTIKRSKIIRNVRGSGNRYKKPINDIKPESSHVNQNLEFIRDPNVSSNDIKKTSFYYWISAKMCTSCTHKIDKSQRENSNIENRDKSRHHRINEDFENNVHNEFDKSKLNIKKNINGLIEENKFGKSVIITPSTSTQNSPKSGSNTKLNQRFSPIKNENRYKSHIDIPVDYLKPINFILETEDKVLETDHQLS